MNSHIRGVADGYAADGYVAIAPALFDRALRGFECGYTPPEIETGRALMQKLDWDDAMRDIERQAGAANVKLTLLRVVR